MVVEVMVTDYIETRILKAALLRDRLQVQKLLEVLNESETEALAEACRMINGEAYNLALHRVDPLLEGKLGDNRRYDSRSPRR
jgi:hypothetical protein